MYICSYCGESYSDSRSYIHTEDECKDIILERIEYKLKSPICLYNLKRLLNFIISLN